MSLSLPATIGQLIVGGFDGESPSRRFLEALRRKERAGAILFRRNLPTLEAAHAQCRSLVEHSPDLPPFIGVDQEGGRVVRLPAPALTLPAMRHFGKLGDIELVRRAARAVAFELVAIGFNLDFAPVLDVDTNPDNPVIGDRAFGSDPETVSRAGVAFAQGLQAQGILACGKHFPGHGDTHLDSHLDLPVIHHPRERLDRVELVPFRAAVEARIGSMMTAHIVCEALDPSVPATLSRAIVTDLLRNELGFDGVVFSDDLEMKAIADRYSYEDAAIMAIEAGCDVLLVCRDEDAQDRVFEALLRRAERDASFLGRCREAAERSLSARRAFSPKPAASYEEVASAMQSPERLALQRDLSQVIA